MALVWERFNPKSTFFVEQIEWISDIDHKMLARTYQPIIGPIAYALYESLYSFVGKETFQSEELYHSHLMEQMVLGKEQFIKARQALEGIGLLQVFQKTGSEQFKYLLKSPLSPDRFFQDTVMQTLLLDRVGMKRFEKIKGLFSITLATDQTQWQDQTVDFQDVYRLRSPYEQIPNADTQIVLKSNSKRAVNLNNVSSFDMDYFVELLQGSFVANNVITAEVRELTLTLHVMYGFDEVDLQRLALAAYNVRQNEISLTRYREDALREAKNAISSNKDEAHANRAQNTPVETQQWQQKGLTASELKLTQQMREYPPIAFIKSIKEQRNGYLTKREGRLIERLLSDGKLAPAVINMLSHFFLVQLNNSSLNEKWIDETANDWAKEHIDSPEAAMVYIKERQSHIQNKKQTKRKQSSNYKEVEPEWFKQASTKNNQKKAEVSPKKVTSEQSNEAVSRMQNLINSVTKGDEDSNG